MVYALQYARTGLAMAIVLILSLVTGQRADAARQGELRPVRATLGCVEVRNWENNLVKVNPNLRHYHWNPIYVNVQGTRLVGPPAPPKQCLTSRGKKQVLAGRPKKQDAKIDNKNYLFRPVQERRSVYKQPTRVAPHRSTNTQIAYKHVAPSMRHTNTSLAYKHASPQLSNRDMMGRLIPPGGQQDPVTATDLELRRKAMMAKLSPPSQSELSAKQGRMGNMAMKSVSGTLATRDCNAQLAAKEVEGQLIAKACEAKIAAPAAYAPYNRTAAVDGNSRRITKTSVDAQVRGY
jgi:hypothetical protein